MFKRHFVSAIVFGMAATAPPTVATANTPCADRTTITDNLAAKYDEHQAGLGTQSTDRLVEIWTSDETGSWTILMTLADGTSCVLAAGQNWHGTPASEILAKKGEPS